MTTQEMMVVNYFTNILQLFYKNNKDFKDLIDDGLEKPHGWDFSCGDSRVCVYTGSARACFVFETRNGVNEMFNKYVVKIAREVLNGARIVENERQNENEYNNYLSFKKNGYDFIVPETIQGPSLNELFGLNTILDSHIYIAERADIDSDRFYNLCYKAIRNNWKYEEEWVADYLDTYYHEEGTDYTDEEWDDAIWNYIEDMSGASKLLLACQTFGIKLDGELEDQLENIGDAHDENVGFTEDGRMLLIDFGWHTVMGNNSYIEGEKDCA